MRRAQVIERQIGSQRYYNDGTIATDAGSTTLYNDGSYANHAGNSTMYSNGTTGTRVGDNMEVYSNGHSCMKAGGVVICH
ncbi:hypothetical protein [Caballeronia grimmiae]|uniref:hypothetical protein n=1 Tax=Caballeronia grimmiae TaxID=1071679 RepID=UPI0038BDBB41